MNSRSLRLLALLGAALALVVGLVTARPDEHGLVVLLVVLALLVAAVAVILATVLRGETRRLVADRDLLVPFGLWLGVRALLRGLLGLPALDGVLGGSGAFQVLGFGVSLSAGLLVEIVLAVVLLTWTHGLVVRSVTGEGADACSGFAVVRGSWLRVFVLSAVCVAAQFALLVVVLPVFQLAMPLGIALMLVGILVLDFATAGLLLRAVARPRERLVACVRAGVAASLANARHWWLPLVLQLLVLGTVYYVHADWQGVEDGRMVHNVTDNFGVQGQWTGGLSTESKWLEEYAEAYEVEVPAFVALLASLALGVLAVAIKLRVAEVLARTGALTEPAAPPDDTPAPEASA